MHNVYVVVGVVAGDWPVMCLLPTCRGVAIGGETRKGLIGDDPVLDGAIL